MLKADGYIPNMLGHSRYNRRLHRISYLFETLFNTLAQISISLNPQGIYAIDTFLVAVGDNIRISRCRCGGVGDAPLLFETARHHSP